jgi:pimeloyl-ACP methyl ester carboxylesterase
VLVRDYRSEDLAQILQLWEQTTVAESGDGWIAMNHAIYAPDRLRRLVLLGPMGLPPWHATLAVLVPFAGYAMRPTEAKFERIIFRALGEGERANRAFRPWMRLMGKGKARVGQPIRIPGRKLRTIKAPTLVVLGGKDGLVGSAAAAAKRARIIPSSEIEILPQAGHIMSVDEPEFVGKRIAAFLGHAP